MFHEFIPDEFRHELTVCSAFIVLWRFAHVSRFITFYLPLSAFNFSCTDDPCASFFLTFHGVTLLAV
jgi:hypothetical protein